MSEVEECGWISQEHFQQFLHWTFKSQLTIVSASEMVTDEMLSSVVSKRDFMKYVKRSMANKLTDEVLKCSDFTESHDKDRGYTIFNALLLFKKK